MSRADELAAMAEELGRRIADSSDRDAVALVRARADLLKELDELGGADEGDEVEQILARNSAGGAGTVSPIAAGRRGQQRRRGGRSAS